MTLGVVSGDSFLNFNSPVIFKPLPPKVAPQISEISAPSPTIPSSDSASTHSASSSNGISAAASSSSAMVPESVLTALYDYVSPAQQAWNALTQSLKLGDLSSAQSALDDYTTSLSAPNDALTLAITTPSATFLEDLKSVGDALAAGSLAVARSAFESATEQRPDTAAEAVDSAQGLVQQDGWIAVYTLEHPGSGAIDQVELASDIAGLDGALREEQTTIGDELVALGYSQTDANNYAHVLTGIGNASAADNATEDATRSTQWIQGLIATAQNGTAAVSGAEDQVSINLGQSLSTLLTGIEFANIDNWRHLQYLIGSTINSTISANSGVGGNSSASAVNGAPSKVRA